MIMAISIWGIKRLARRLDVKLELRAILLCALTALVINFSAISVSSFLTARHYLLLTVLILTGSAIVTIYNAKLTKRRALADTDLLWARIHADLEFTPLKNPSVEPSFSTELAKATDTQENLSLAAEAGLSSTTDNSIPSYDNDTLSETIPAKSAMEENVYNSVEEFLTDKPAPAFEAVVPADEPAVPTTTEPENTLFDEISSRFEAELEARHDAILAQQEAVAIADPFIGITSTDTTDSQNIDIPDIFEQPVAISTDTEEKIETAEDKSEPSNVIEEPPFDNETVAAFKSLDEFLDYADEQKNLHYTQNAIYTYEQALIRYSDDDYAPFIVIDMANICKAAGQYRKAIAIYQLAFTLRTVRGSDAIREDFHKTLAYLETVEYILSQHNAPELPFKEIPADLLAEIEQEFAQRQKEKIVS